MATITITDRADGTGADAAIAGSIGTNNLYVARFSGSLPLAEFSLVGTLIGDGVIPIAEGNGPFIAVLQSDGIYLAPVGFRVTDGTKGTHAALLPAIRDFIRSLSLPLIPADESLHRLHKSPIRSMKEFGEKPNGCHYWVERETSVPADNNRLSVTYPVSWVYVSGHSGQNVFDGDWTSIRQKIAQGFRACPLEAVEEVHTVIVDYLDIYAGGGGKLQVDLQGLTFRCVTEQPSLLD